MQLQSFEVHVFASELEERFEGCGKFNGRFRPLKITAKREGDGGEFRSEKNVIDPVGQVDSCGHRRVTKSKVLCS